VLRTLKHGQNRTSCVLDKRYAEQQCRRYSRQRAKGENLPHLERARKKGPFPNFPQRGTPLISGLLTCPWHACGRVLCPKCASLATQQQQARHRQRPARHQTTTNPFGVVRTTASSKASALACSRHSPRTPTYAPSWVGQLRRFFDNSELVWGWGVGVGGGFGRRGGGGGLPAAAFFGVLRSEVTRLLLKLRASCWKKGAALSWQKAKAQRAGMGEREREREGKGLGSRL
jgi:hypothetical protein